MASDQTRQLVTKLLFIIALAVACAAGVWKLPINRGLDLEGGTELLYAVRPTGIEGMQPDLVSKTIAVVQRRIDPQGVLDADIRPRGGQHEPHGAQQARFHAAPGRGNQPQETGGSRLVPGQVAPGKPGLPAAPLVAGKHR